MLAKFGYDVPASGYLDGTTRDAVAAFQRHFRPQRVDGIVDVSTLATLKALVAARDARLQCKPDELKPVARREFAQKDSHLALTAGRPTPHSHTRQSAGRLLGPMPKGRPERKVRAPWTYGAG